jgi:hypothetical protein
MEDDLRMASALARVAFSSTCGQTCFRIVSRETIGHSGGCVLKNDLSCYYVERFALGKITQVSNAIWSFVPAEEPASIYSSVLPEATCHFGNKGLSFSVRGTDFAALGWMSAASEGFSSSRIPDLALSRDLELNSTIGNTEFKMLNLRVHLEDYMFSFSSRSPETLMRLVAYFLDGAVIRLDPGSKYVNRKVLVYKPVALGKSDAVKGYMVLPAACTETWLNFPVKDVPKVSAEQMASIARRCAIPEICQNDCSKVFM